MWSGDTPVGGNVSLSAIHELSLPFMYTHSAGIGVLRLVMRPAAERVVDSSQEVER